jgi:hypothetical protein
MSPQQKLLWEKITKEVRTLGGSNLEARELYDKLSKLLNMSDRVVLSITEKEDGLEVKIGEQAYGNIAIVGLLEKIKLNILSDIPEVVKEEKPVTKTTQKYDA